MTHAQNLIRGIIALIVLTAFGALIVTNPVVTSVVGGVLWSRDFNASLAAGYEERNFRAECPIYRDASTWDRWFNSRVSSVSWCKNYIDRL